jgi:hypothetical protein
MDQISRTCSDVPPKWWTRFYVEPSRATSQWVIQFALVFGGQVEQSDFEDLPLWGGRQPNNLVGQI